MKAWFFVANVANGCRTLQKLLIKTILGKKVANFIYFSSSSSSLSVSQVGLHKCNDFLAQPITAASDNFYNKVHPTSPNFTV